MWFLLGILSAIGLGCYDIAKKKSLQDNAVVPVLLMSVVCSSILLLPLWIISRCNPALLQDTLLYVPQVDLHTHLLILLKSAIVLSSWLFAYMAMKHLPLTIVTPINATRPMWTLVGALLIFGEQLSGWQWGGILLAIASFISFSLAGKREGIQFSHNRWIGCLLLATLLGAASGLYDKHLMQHVDHNAVQVYYTFYQAAMMVVTAAVLWWPRRKEQPFHWSWHIVLISVFLILSDFFYLLALTDSNSLISILSVVRRSSVLISFAYGAIVMHEQNIRLKVYCLCGVLAGMLMLMFGTL
ncbi:MAG: DMT family transporter [Paludibacteraceae bacterium]|nr:DMT family transporter [Paludibacteraceae bacterium]